jgi:hypothetical protein
MRKIWQEGWDQNWGRRIVENDLLGEVLESFINPKEEKSSLWKTLTRKKEDIKAELLLKQERMILLKDYVASKHWREVARPALVDSLKTNFGRLLRDGLTLSETDTKICIAEMRQKLDIIATMRYEIEQGEKASEELARYEAKNNGR